MKKRILGYDIARALAIIGMVIVNFRLIMVGDGHGPHWLLTFASLFEGRAAATFVVLAGAGLSLLSQRARHDHDLVALGRNRVSLLKRALFLFVVGLLYAPLWPADILHFYGIYITVGALVLAASTRRLWQLAGAFVLGFVILLFVFDYEAGWDWETFSYDGFWTPAGFVRNLFFNGFHPVFPWTAFLLIGMVLGRQDLRNPAVRKRVMAWGLGAAVLAETVSRILIKTLSAGASAVDLEVITTVFGTASMPPMPLYIIAGAGTACVVIAACVALGERYASASWLKPLVATGQLALTLYVAHVVIGMGLLEALGRLEHQTPAFAVGSALVFSALSVLFAHLWRQRFNRGPLEWIMRLSIFEIKNRKSFDLEFREPKF